MIHPLYGGIQTPINLRSSKLQNKERQCFWWGICPPVHINSGAPIGYAGIILHVLIIFSMGIQACSHNPIEVGNEKKSFHLQRGRFSILIQIIMNTNCFNSPQNRSCIIPVKHHYNRCNMLYIFPVSSNLVIQRGGQQGELYRLGFKFHSNRWNMLYTTSCGRQIQKQNP